MQVAAIASLSYRHHCLAWTGLWIAAVRGSWVHETVDRQPDIISSRIWDAAFPAIHYDQWQRAPNPLFVVVTTRKVFRDGVVGAAGGVAADVVALSSSSAESSHETENP